MTHAPLLTAVQVAANDPSRTEGVAMIYLSHRAIAEQRGGDYPWGGDRKDPRPIPSVPRRQAFFPAVK